MQTPCDKCGLRAVRRELERVGVMYRFCDECYWGELAIEGLLEKADSRSRGRQEGGKPSGND